MRTRNADTTKSGAAKKTPPAKKNASATAAAEEKTPETQPKATPKSGAKTSKAAGKQPANEASISTPTTTTNPVAAAAMTDPKPEHKVEDLATPMDGKKPAVATAKSTGKKKVASAKSPEKKATGKAKSPLAQKVSAAATPLNLEEIMTEKAQKGKEDVSNEEVKEDVNVKEVKAPKLDMKVATEGDPAKNEEDDAHAEEQMEEDPEPEGVQEPGDEELVGEEEDVGEVEGDEVAEGVEEEEGPQVEEDEQFEISDMAKKRKIKKQQEIFVGGLDRDAVEEDIKKAFEKIGEVVEVRLHKDFVTNKNKGFAFVKFAKKEQAARALEELRNPVIRGKRCGIAPSEDNDTLFLGNICNTWTKEAIKRKLNDYGIDGVENITLVLDTQNEGLSRGFAFLEFSCHTEAMLAYKRLQKPDAIFGHPERTAKVAFAEPLREPDPEVMAQVKSVFVDGLPPYWDEDCVKEQFKGYGEIERVVLARNMSTAKRMDFGFVNFTTHESAVACAEGVNNTELGDGKSKMKVRARLANPLPKTQAVKGGMSGGYRIGHAGIGVYNRFGRGFSRGGYFPHRGGFQAGRGFNLRGRGRGIRFPFAADADFENVPEFLGRRPFGFRGGRRYTMSGGHDAYGRGRGEFFASRGRPFPPEEDIDRLFGTRYLGDDPYFYRDVGHGVKRPFSMMDHDSSYWELGSRLRPRYDYPDPVAGVPRYRDSLGMGGLYSRDYYGSDYRGSNYSSMYGGEHSRGGYYH